MAEVIKPGATEGTKYFSLPEALKAAENGDTVKLLADHVTDWDAVDDPENPDESTLTVVTKELTLDLNGCTVDYLMVGDMTLDRYNEETGEYENVSLTPGNLTVVSTSEGTAGKIKDLDFVSGTLEVQGGQLGYYEGYASDPRGGLTCNGNSGEVTIKGGRVLGLTVGEGASVTVSGGSGHAGGWFNYDTLNITGGEFSNVTFSNNGGIIAISGGTFELIRNHDGNKFQPLMILLAPDHAFYDNDIAVLLNGSATSLTNVTVKTHTHDFTDGKCACGVEKVVSDNKGGYYSTLQAALDKAAQDSSIDWVQLEQDLTEDVTFNGIDGTVTLKMNGKKLEWDAGPVLTVNSGILIIDGNAVINQTGDETNGNTAGSPASAIKLVNGKLVFNGELTAQGGKLWANAGGRKPAVLAEDGELEFKNKVFLCGGLTMKGDSTLTGGLKVGSEFTANNNETQTERIDVSGHSTYSLPC